MKFLRKAFIVEGVAIRPASKPAYGHHVRGQGAGLVNTDHRRRTKCFDDRRPSSQDVTLRHPPRTYRKEHGHYDRKFLGQYRHGRRDPGKGSRQPIASNQAVYDDHHSRRTYPQDGDDPHQR